MSKNVLTITGSALKESSNHKFLKSLPSIITNFEFVNFDGLIDFPLFTPELDKTPPKIVSNFKQHIQNSDIIVIATPEYTYNIPAVLKNALEWITSSGELYNKKVIAITYTPNAPRGEKAMQSLLWSLQALNANVIAELPLYQSELKVNNNGTLEGTASIENLKALFDFID